MVIALSIGIHILYNRASNHKADLATGASARLFSKLVDHNFAHPYFVKQCEAGDVPACAMARRIAPLTDREAFLWGQAGRPAVAAEDDAWHDRERVYARWDVAIIRNNLPGVARAALADSAILSTNLTLSVFGRDLIAHGAPHDVVLSWMKIKYPGEVGAFGRALQQRSDLTRFFPTSFYTACTLFGYVGCIITLIAAAVCRRLKLAQLAGLVLVTLIVSTLVHGGLSTPIPRYTVKSSWLATFVVVVACSSFFSSPKARPSAGCRLPWSN